VIINGQKFILQLVPCGVLRPGCRGVIGNGVVLDPMAFLKETGRLRDLGIDVDSRLFVSNRAQVILPYHRMIELAAESAPGRQKIGTTSRGIGPAYEDKMARSGLRVVDLLNTSLLKTHIENACREKNAIAHALFGTEPLDPAQMYEEYAAAAEKVRPFVTDTALLLNKALSDGQSVMFEGAQGTMLDIDHGTYPFVTSSSAAAGGASTGTGVGPTRIGTVSDGDFRRSGREAACARAGVWGSDGTATAVRLAGFAAAAVLKPDQRDRVASDYEAGCAGRSGLDSCLHGVRSGWQAVRDNACGHTWHRCNTARVHSAEGVEDLDGRGSEIRGPADGGAGVSAFHGTGVGREDRHRIHRPGSGSDP
jgi:hypothetical protein